LAPGSISKVAPAPAPASTQTDTPSTESKVISKPPPGPPYTLALTLSDHSPLGSSDAARSIG
jgi:hypothetical protein